MTATLRMARAGALLLALLLPTTSAHAVAPRRDKDGWSELRIHDQVDGVAHIGKVLVYRPVGYAHRARGTRYPLVIALHGWGHTPAMYREHGELARWADAHQVVVAIPAMGKSVYETQFYAESKKAWSKIPGTRWVGEVVLPYLRAALAVLPDRAHTAIIGYSTGGRGALLVAEAYPEFAFAGSLSGTFDLIRLRPGTGEYKIHALVYGSRDAHPDRWTHDNVVAPEHLAGLAGMTLFVAHGAADRVVDPDQLAALADAVHDRADVTATFTLVPEAGHDWTFWSAQAEAMFASLARVVNGAPSR